MVKQFRGFIQYMQWRLMIARRNNFKSFALLACLLITVCWLTTYIYLFFSVYPYQFNVNIHEYSDYATYVKRKEPIANFGSFLATPSSSLKFNTLDEQLKTIATKQNEVIITIATKNFSDLLFNWLCSLATLHTSEIPPLDHLLIYTVDQSFANRLISEHGIAKNHVYVDPMQENDDKDLKYDTKDYQILMLYRTRFISRVLKMGYRVLLVDHDTVWFQSPLPYIHKKYKNMDLVAQNDDPNPVVGLRTIICGGFLYLNTTVTMTKYWDIVAEKHEQQIMSPSTTVKYTEQDLLNHYRGHLKVQLLPWQHYPSGACYFSHSGHIQKVFPDVHVVHNNWVIGRTNKMNRFYSLKGFLWLLTDDPSQLKCNYRK